MPIYVLVDNGVDAKTIPVNTHLLITIKKPFVQVQKSGKLKFLRRNLSQYAPLNSNYSSTFISFHILNPVCDGQ